MKVSIFGKTLYSGVMAALLAECGHQVYWCNIFQEAQHIQHHFQDESVDRILEKQLKSGFLQYCDFSELALDIDVYLFSFSPAEEQIGLSILSQLQQRPIIHPKLMINASTLGLHGTDKFKNILPEDDWVYLPDTIQEGNAIQSLIQAKQLIVGSSQQNVQTKIKEFLRPLFPRTQQYLFMSILDAEFTK
ncbi:MAG: UDP-glucose 6-dehydrogenase, partial [Acinetobacter sp.]